MRLMERNIKRNTTEINIFKKITFKFKGIKIPLWF